MKTFLPTDLVVYVDQTQLIQLSPVPAAALVAGGMDLKAGPSGRVGILKCFREVGLEVSRTGGGVGTEGRGAER